MPSNNRLTHVHTVVHTAHDAHVSQCDIFGVSMSPVFIVKENEFLIRSLQCSCNNGILPSPALAGLAHQRKVCVYVCN